MDELMDILVSKDESASQISDKIKDLLFAKSAEKIENIRPEVASSIFDEPEVESELDQDNEVEEEDESSEEE
jgi:hypothetical protein